MGGNAEYSDVQMESCVIESCILAQFGDPQFGLIVRDSSVRDCRIMNCSVQQVRFIDSIIDGLATTQPFLLYGCVFDCVSIRGSVGPIMAVGPHDDLPKKEEFIVSIVSQYDHVSLALDISEAIFEDADFYYVPGDLVRRDEETQALLRRDIFQSVDPADLPAYAKIWVSRFEVSPFDSIVAIAPKKSPKFHAYMQDLRWLRSVGLAD